MNSMRVLVGDVWIEVGPDGSVTWRADGSTITRRTADRVEGLTPDGVVSKARRLE